MDDNQALLQRVQCYEEAALVEVYDRFSPGVFRYALRLLGEEDLAEECVSETFSRFLAALKHGNGPSQYLQAYLYRIAHNWITDFFRRKQTVLTRIERESDGRPDHDPQAFMIQDEDGYPVREALARLTPDQLQVIVLKYLEQWKNEEIAAALGKPVGAVKSLQHRALDSLRRLLNGEVES